MACLQTGANVKMFEDAGNCSVFHGICAGSPQPVGAGDDAASHWKGYYALSLLRKRDHAFGWLDTERGRPQWI